MTEGRPQRPRSQQDWNARYEEGFTPWDSGQPSQVLMETLPTLPLQDKQVLEFGCGTGSDAMWMAQQGFSVVAMDIAPTAIDRAKRRAAEAGVSSVKFICQDVLAKALEFPEKFDVVFDRGVFHTTNEDNREPFVRRVHNALRPGGWWISLAGNADETIEGSGPPRLTAAQLTAVVEPFFSIQSLRAFHLQGQERTFLFWAGLYQRREQT